MIEKLGNNSLVVIKDGNVIFSSSEGMLSPIIACINKHKNEMEDSIAIDKVVGLAAAKLLTYAKVKEIHAKIASKPAVNYLKTINAENIVEKIMNTSQQCPMEKLAETLTGEQLFEKLNK